MASNTCFDPLHMVATAATFIPISYKVLARFKVKQFSSVTVDPIEMPKICVCTAPATPTVQRSEFPFEKICGEMAEGGGELTVVSIVPVVVTVLVVVDSVTIGSSCACEVIAIDSNPKTTMSLFIVTLRFR